MNEDNKNGLAEITARIDDLEQAIEESADPKIGGKGKKIVDVEEISTLVESIRSALPAALERAEGIIEDRQEMLDEASRQADAVIADAEKAADRLAEEHEIARRAAKIAEQTRREVEEIEVQVRSGAEGYARETLAHVEATLETLLGNVRACEERMGTGAAVDVDVEDLVDENLVGDDGSAE